ARLGETIPSGLTAWTPTGSPGLKDLILANLDPDAAHLRAARYVQRRLPGALDAQIDPSDGDHRIGFAEPDVEIVPRTIDERSHRSVTVGRDVDTDGRDRRAIRGDADRNANVDDFLRQQHTRKLPGPSKPPAVLRPLPPIEAVDRL